ncbi:uroporphyrinogen-III synthase [Phytomonospora sp. NPDC050363]|uniref:uroporphyrinogen-III synthase n=1 Tax=Phytomonospora sp. NPDC050363 TaxID=3155642 RepID=UPI0033E37C01
MTGPLTGYTVAVTAQRRSDEQTAMLVRRGARVVAAPTVRIVPLSDDRDLRAATEDLLRDPPDITVATTGIGFRGWLETAEGWGLGERLREALGRGRLWARGPKALGAIRAAGLDEEWSAPGELGSEIVERLAAQDITGLRVAVQIHGDPVNDFLPVIEAGGGTGVTIPVYRCAPPTDLPAARQLAEQIRGGRVDAVTFTSAPAAKSLLRIAGRHADELVAVLREGTVLAAAVGPVTAAPLEKLGIPVVQPDRPRLGALVRTVAAMLPERAVVVRLSTGERLDVRGHLVLVDGEPRALAPAPMAVLRELAAAGGRVLSRDKLLAVLPRGSDGHAVEMAVNRLREGLGLKGSVSTVIKRGYRISVD